MLCGAQRRNRHLHARSAPPPLRPLRPAPAPPLRASPHGSGILAAESSSRWPPAAANVQQTSDNGREAQKGRRAVRGEDARDALGGATSTTVQSAKGKHGSTQALPLLLLLRPFFVQLPNPNPGRPEPEPERARPSGPPSCPNQGRWPVRGSSSQPVRSPSTRSASRSLTRLSNPGWPGGPANTTPANPNPGLA